MCIVISAGCAMNLFGVADMQLTRRKVLIDALHHLQHVFSHGHPLIPLRVGGLCMLHLSRQDLVKLGILVHVLHTQIYGNV